MRQITEQSINAFYNHNHGFKKQNMSVIKDESTGFTSLLLHGNFIAYLDSKGKLSISNAGWFSNTTKERLNGLDGVHIYQEKGVWYLNGKEWNGEWTEI